MASLYLHSKKFRYEKVNSIDYAFASSFLRRGKQKNVEEGVDVYSTHSNTYNGSEFRSESISADITGHILTNLRI